jgi:hypothetical protein
MRSGIFFTRRVDDPNRVEAIQEISFEGWQQVAGSIHLISSVADPCRRSATRPVLDACRAFFHF